MFYRRGSILIVVLFVMTILSLVAISFAYRAGLENRSANEKAVMAQLQAQAASAAAIAIGRLMENTNDFDHWAEPWHTHGPLAAEDWLAEWEELPTGRPAAFVTDYDVIDEEGKLNIAYASSEALQKLGMTPEQIASLFDWIDADDSAQAEGAEKEFYLARTPPYFCKNAPVELLDELLCIRGFGSQDYWGKHATLALLPDNGTGNSPLGWVDLLTCVGDGKININTAPKAVLATLPLSDGAVDQIIGFRTFDEQSGGKLEDHVFRTEEDIRQLQGLTDTDKDVLVGISAFKSTHFRILVQSVHQPTGLQYFLQVLVRIGQDGPEILQWKTGL